MDPKLTIRVHLRLKFHDCQHCVFKDRGFKIESREMLCYKIIESLRKCLVTKAGILYRDFIRYVPFITTS